MTTATTTAAAAPVDRSPRRRSVGAWVLVGVAVLAGLVSVSVNAPMDDPFERDARVLISTFGVGMAVLAALVAAVPLRRGEAWAWWALWVWPAFFVVHVLALGTVVPDAVLAVVSVGALLGARPARLR